MDTTNAYVIHTAPSGLLAHARGESSNEWWHVLLIATEMPAMPGATVDDGGEDESLKFLIAHPEGACYWARVGNDLDGFRSSGAELVQEIKHFPVPGL